MAEREETFRWQTVSGEPVTVGDIVAIPQSQALTARWPVGGWVWNRPTALLVERGEERERVPIVDVTRVAQLGLYGLGLVCAIVGLVLMARQRRR
jgi:hypothetical protein